VSPARVTVAEEAIWHDIECGGYAADLALWRTLAAGLDGPILEIGAGTGRVTLDLAREGHGLTALDHDATLIGELRRRAAGYEIDAVVADACDFSLPRRFALIAVPMQTVQVLGGRSARVDFMGCAQRHLLPDGVVAIAISEALETYDLADGHPIPVPDMAERDGIVYFSQPTAVRCTDGGYALERRRERIDPHGTRTVEVVTETLATLSAPELEAEAAEAGLRASDRIAIPATTDHVGSTVVILRG
jgi:SAM-dependent methyltransferase